MRVTRAKTITNVCTDSQVLSARVKPQPATLKALLHLIDPNQLQQRASVHPDSSTSRWFRHVILQFAQIQRPSRCKLELKLTTAFGFIFAFAFAFAFYNSTCRRTLLHAAFTAIMYLLLLPWVFAMTCNLGSRC